MPRATITAQDTWTAPILTPGVPGKEYSMMLGIGSTTRTGSLVTVRWWRMGMESADAFEYGPLSVADGGSHTLTFAGPVWVQAGVKTGHYTTGDNFPVDLG